MNKVWLGIGVAVVGALTIGVTAGQSVRALFSATSAVAATAPASSAKTSAASTSAPVIDTHAVPQAVAAKALWSDDGRSQLEAYFDGAFGDPKAVVAMTRALLSEAARDDRWRQPEQASAAALRLRKVLLGLHTRAYYAPAGIEGALTLGSGDRGWALGEQTQAARGVLASVVKGSPQVRGADLKAFTVPNADGVLAHGLTNLNRFADRLPNGDYRVILISHATRDGRSTAWPFGKDVRVNGARRQFVETDITEAGGWIELGDAGLISHHPVEVAAAAGGAPQSGSTLAGITPARTGVALIVPAMVRSGRLVLSMAAAGAEPVAVSAIIAQRTDYNAMHFTTGRLITGALAGVVGSADAAQSVIADAQAFAAPSQKPGGLAIAVGAKEVQLADAVRGATTGDEAGLTALQAYFDDTAGNPSRLMGRVKAVARLAQVDLAEDSEPRNRIRAAALATQSAAFITRGQIRRDYRVGKGGYAWDFVQADKAVYGDFRRITPQSAELTGANLTMVDIAPWRSNLTTEGIQGVETFKTKVRNGRYRAYIYSPKIYQPGGSPESFGGALAINDAAVARRVDLRNRSPELWLRHGAPGLAYLGGYEGATDARQRYAATRLDSVDMAASQVLPERGHCGLVLSVPATVKDGELTLDFSPDAGKRPTIAGLVLVPEGGGVDPLFDPASGARQGPRGAPAASPPASDVAPDIDPAAGTEAPGFGFGGEPTQFAAAPQSETVSDPRGTRRSGGTTTTPGSGSGGGGITDQATSTSTGGDSSTTGGTTTGGTTTGGTTTGGDGSTTGGTTTGGTTTGGTTTGGTTTGGTTTGGTTTGGDGSTTGGTTTGGTTTGGTTTGGDGSTTGGTTTGGTTTGGTTTGGSTSGTDITITPDAGPDYEVCLNDEVNLLGAANLSGGIDLSDVTVEWLLATTGGSGTVYTSLNINSLTGTLQTGAGTLFDVPGIYELVLRVTYDGKEYLDTALLTVCPECSTDVSEPPTAPLMVLGAAAMLWWRRRRG